MQMSDEVKDLLVSKMDEFLSELASNEGFTVGDCTAVLLADGAEVVWNAMEYATRLERS